MLTDIVEKVSSNIVRIDVNINGEWGNGTGIVVDNMGTILTCDHVIHPNGINAKEILVKKEGEMPIKAEIIKSNHHYDLATIKVDGLGRNEQFKTIDYENIRIGQDCFVLGYPIGLPHLTFAKSTISAKGKALVNYLQFETFQIDARVNLGNSGGPLFTNNGEVIGIITMKYVPFFHTINELVTYVNSVPHIPVNIKMPYGDFSFTDFVNSVHEGIRRLSHAIEIIQVGIGWIIPIHFMSQVTQN